MRLETVVSPVLCTRRGRSQGKRASWRRFRFHTAVVATIALQIKKKPIIPRSIPTTGQHSATPTRQSPPQLTKDKVAKEPKGGVHRLSNAQGRPRSSKECGAKPVDGSCVEDGRSKGRRGWVQLGDTRSEE